MTNAAPRKKIAIITGASAGIGSEFALQIEKNFFLDEIWLVARRAGPMRELAEKFLKSRAVILSMDLTSRSDLVALEKRLAEERPEVDFLVNNAGFGKFGPFSRLGLEEQMKMIELNVGALTFLSRAVLPYMKPGASMIQVASSAAFSPSPYFAVYSATKAYVLSLSDALGHELRGHGIRVISVCPGPVETEFFSVAQKSEYMAGKVGEAEPQHRSLHASSQAVVAKALSDLSWGRRRSIYGFFFRLLCLVSAWVPVGLRLRLLAHHNQRK
ncbi:MAG TPA: SDR family NAD(P)-dependent oxidoreductase [Bdellovibrionota bacterium]|jgi:hypothetical protein